VILADHAFLLMCFLSFAFCIVFFQAFSALPIDLRARGVSPSQFGGLIALNGLLIVLLQPAAGELITGRSRPIVLAIASLFMGVGFGMNAWAHSLAAYAASVAVWTLGEILFAPASTTLVADMSPVAMRGRYQGVFATAFTGAFAAAPAVGGYVLAHAGARVLWIACVAAGVSVAAGFLMLLTLRRTTED
jgi:MFS family permease